MFQNHSFQQGSDHVLFVRIEAGYCFELQPQIVIRPTFVLAKKEHIRTHLQSRGDLTDHVQRGPGGACLVTPQLEHVDSNPFGQLLLGEAVLPTQSRELPRELGQGNVFTGHVPNVPRGSKYVARKREHTMVNK